MKLKNFKFNILAKTKKERLNNDIVVLQRFLNADHEFIQPELIEAVKNELERIYNLYQQK